MLYKPYLADARHTGEYLTRFRVRGRWRQVWLGTCNPEDARRLEIDEIAITRRTRYKPLAGPSGKRVFWWVVFDYAWVHARRTMPSGPPHMLAALSRPEAYLAMRLRRFFKWRRLSTIAAKDVLEYQSRRFEEGVGPDAVTKEIACLFRILKWARLGKLVRQIKGQLYREPVKCNWQWGWTYALREPVTPPTRLVYKPMLVRRRARQSSLPQTDKSPPAQAQRSET